MVAIARIGGTRLVQAQTELSNQCQEMAATLNHLEIQNGQDRETVKRQREAIVQAWTKGLGFNRILQAQIHQGEESAYQELHALLCRIRFTTILIDEATTTLKQLTNNRQQLQQQISQVVRQHRTLTVIRFVLAVVLVGLAFTPLVVARKRQQQQRTEESGQCPRCLAEQGLKDKAPPQIPATRICEQCSYEAPATYLKLARLCFPTVGVRSSGKTHWLVMCYHLIKNNNVPVKTSFTSALSENTEDVFEKLDEIRQQRKGLPATVYRRSDPLTYRILDQDHWGANASMLNLFDYSGEMTDQRVNVDELRRRAVLMEGFLLFPDPTQVGKQGSSVGIDYQVRALMKFYEDMRLMRDLDEGQKIDVPIAVCLSKLDLLMKHNPMGQAARRWLRVIRETQHMPLTLETLAYRSQLCQEVLPSMFPAWNIVRTLQEHFGNRYFFFPMTPVGLEELDKPNLQDRVHIPFGVFEPILWLLHMHGYHVLT
jgi:hypothetical protein